MLLATQIDNISIWVSVLKVAVPLVGLAMSVFHAGIIARNIDAADFWRSSIGLIEGDPDFWEYTESGNLVQGTDNGRATRQAQQPLRLSQLPGFINFIKKLHPNPIFGFWLPLLIFILWLLTLIWGCVQLWTVHFKGGFPEKSSIFLGA